jgi:molecular chaperone DnaK
MYQQAGGAQPGAGAGFNGGQGFNGGAQGGQQSNPDDNVQDADLEEVK